MYRTKIAVITILFLLLTLSCTSLSGKGTVGTMSEGNSGRSSSAEPAHQKNDPETPLHCEVFKKDFPDAMMGMTFDHSGNMYIASHGDNPLKILYRITPDGKMTAIASLDGRFQFLNASQNDYVYASAITSSEKGSGKVLRFSLNGKFSVISEGFIQPVAITFDTNRNLYVVDAMAKKVYRITPKGEKSVFINLESGSVSTDNLYHGMAFDKKCKNLYIAGINIAGGTGNLLKIPVDGQGKPGNPHVMTRQNALHVVVSDNGNVFVTGYNGSLIILGSDGSAEASYRDPLLANGMYLCFGEKRFGKNTLYVNTFEKITRIK
jgi:sugar lactone lactonase YvrE